MTDVITNLTYQENTQARKKLISGLESIQAQQKKLSIEFAKGEKSTDEYNKSLAKLNKGQMILKVLLANSNQAAKEAKREVRVSASG